MAAFGGLAPCASNMVCRWWFSTAMCCPTAPNLTTCGRRFGAPTTVADDNQLYREYSTGAKAPPLEIRADGSYAWTDQFNQAPIQGAWTPSAKIADASVGSERVDGVIIKDRAGNPWKVYWRDADQMEMRILCGDASQTGTRMQ